MMSEKGKEDPRMERTVKTRKMHEVTRVSLAQVFQAMDAGEASLEIEGVNYSLGSQRLQLFHRDGTVCVRCGREGSFFVLESHVPTEKAHLNLYGEENGKLILFTKDHILPRSKGGRNSMENYQVMCSPCNNKKGSRDEAQDLALHRTMKKQSKAPVAVA